VRLRWTNDIKDYLLHGEWKEENRTEMKKGSIQHRIVGDGWSSSLPCIGVFDSLLLVCFEGCNVS